MLGKFFSKKKGKKEPAQKKAARDTAPIVDEDETIVINLTAEEKPPAEGIVLKPVRPEAPSPEAQPEVRLAVSSEPKLILEQDAAPPSAAVSDGDAGKFAHDDGDETTVLRTGDLRGDTLPVKPGADPGAAPVQGAAASLCIISEASYGRNFVLSIGRNTVGRGAGNDVALDIGDNMISKDAHMSIAADPKTEKFYIVPGESKNLTYLNGEPLLAPSELNDKDKIQVGITEFVFVQYYGNYLDWR